MHLSDLVGVAIDQTAIGDPECGYFVAELLAYLCKKQAMLAEKNEAFRKCSAKWESSRVATRRGSALRPLIHAILAQAHRDKDVQEFAKYIPNSGLVIKRDKVLLTLPEFSAEPGVVSEWTEKVVYPKLRAMQSKLAEDPVIGNMKKARDENGKFQISRLKSQIEQTVARIAALPKTYYFDIA